MISKPTYKGRVTWRFVNYENAEVAAIEALALAPFARLQLWPFRNGDWLVIAETTWQE
jgi:hypothetical protein